MQQGLNPIHPRRNSVPWRGGKSNPHEEVKYPRQEVKSSSPHILHSQREVRDTSSKHRLEGSEPTLKKGSCRQAHKIEVRSYSNPKQMTSKHPTEPTSSSNPTSKKGSCHPVNKVELSSQMSTASSHKEIPSSSTRKVSSAPVKATRRQVPKREVNSASLRTERSPQTSNNSTPKRSAKPLQFLVTGKQILRRADRANSLPGSSRRPSLEYLQKFHSPKRALATQRRDSTLEGEPLDLQMSDEEDLTSQHGGHNTFITSTPRNRKPTRFFRRASFCQSYWPREQKEGNISKESMFECSGESVATSSNASHCGLDTSTDLNYSSASPEYSSRSSADSTPGTMRVSSTCLSYLDCSDAESPITDGEWQSFWVKYNSSLVKAPVNTKDSYDQCPTPFVKDECSATKTLQDNLHDINSVINKEGLNLTANETQNIVKCAHILGNVLTTAMERKSKEKETARPKNSEPENKSAKLEIKNEILTKEVGEISSLDSNSKETVLPEPIEVKKRYKEAVTQTDIRISSNSQSALKTLIRKKSLTLDLKETVLPLVVKEGKSYEEAMTQTDLSPITKTAPKVFEKLLRRLSRTALEDTGQENVSQAAGLD